MPSLDDTGHARSNLVVSPISQQQKANNPRAAGKHAQSGKQIHLELQVSPP